MNIHEISWILMLHHEYSWVMMHHDHSWCEVLEIWYGVWVLWIPVWLLQYPPCMGSGGGGGMQKLLFLTPCGNWRSFGKTEMSGNTLCNFVDPGSPIFCLTESWRFSNAWFVVNWHFNVLEMAPKTSILSRVYPGHLYYFLFDISATYVSKICCKKTKHR